MAEMNYRLDVNPGFHDRVDCPVTFQVPEADRLEISGFSALISHQGMRLPIQAIEQNEYAAVIPLLHAGRAESYALVQDSLLESPDALLASTGVQIREEAGQITLTLNAEPLTTYVYGNVPARPYFFPLYAPDGTSITRSYPMKPNIDGETRDHPHHRSLWIAHGDINGTDNWSEEPGHGFTRHKSIDNLVSGPVFGRFSTRSTWETRTGAPLLTQGLQVTAWATSFIARIIDIDIDLTADFSDVLFGDTKEGGIVSVRVASALDVSRGGRIVNVYGGTDEGETWGRSSHWCDYSGVTGGRQVGIAILDHPLSFRHPTTWHVRNYGLMTANPFGYSAFTRGVKNGAYVLNRGDTLSFRYRIVLHHGDSTLGNVPNHYLNYACPPTISLSHAYE